MKRAILILATLAFLFGGSAQTWASLVGTTVNSSMYYQGSVTEDDGTETVNPTASFIVGAGENPGGILGETVSATQIVLGITNSNVQSVGFKPGSFNGPVFDFINSGNLITGVTVDSATNLAFTASDITLTTDGSGGQLVELNLQSLAFVSGSNVTVDVTTGSSVPEPSTFIVWSGLAALGLIGCVWRHRAKA
jgi:hypothetical protein